MSGETVTIPANDWGESLRERKALLYRIEQLEGALRQVPYGREALDNIKALEAEREK